MPREIADGFGVLFSTPTLRAAFLLVLGMGVLFCWCDAGVDPAGDTRSLRRRRIGHRIRLIAFDLCIYLWGCCGGVAMSMSRTILQENAPASHRSRVMTTFSLATIGGAPMGSLMMGLAIGAMGVHGSVLIPVAGVLLTVLGVAATHPLWSLRSHGR